MGSKQCVYEGLIIPHGEVFHPPSMMQTFSKEMKEKNGSALNISVNPFCMRCECTVSYMQPVCMRQHAFSFYVNFELYGLQLCVLNASAVSLIA